MSLRCVSFRISLSVLTFMSDTYFMVPSLFLHLSLPKQLHQLLPVTLLFRFFLFNLSDIASDALQTTGYCF
jgi:hypothetical protein